MVLLQKSHIHASVIERVDPLTDYRWSNLVETHSSTLFHSPNWMGVLRDAYGFKPYATIATRMGIPIAGVPMVDIQGIDGTVSVTLPFSDICEVVGNDDEARLEVADSIVEMGQPWEIRTRICELPETSAQITPKKTFLWHIVDVRGDLDQVLARFTKSARRSVSRSLRDGVTLEQASDKEELREWYRLLVRLRKRRHGLLVQPYTFFEAVWDRFIAKGNGVLLLARLNGQIIGGEVDLVWKDSLYAKFSAVDLDYMKFRANHLLTWGACTFANKNGLSYYDLGRTSASQDGLVEFKRSFAAGEEEFQVARLGEHSKATSMQTDFDNMMSALTGLLTRDDIPDEVSKQAGAIMYRFFA